MSTDVDLSFSSLMHLGCVQVKGVVICPFCGPIRSLRISLPGELRLAPHTPSPGWHAVLFLISSIITTTIIIITVIIITLILLLIVCR